MLEKSSIFMMVLLIAASLIGISSIYQPANVETQLVQPQQAQLSKATFGVPSFIESGKAIVGAVNNVETYASSDGKACIASVTLRITDVLGPKKGTLIDLLAIDENICTSLGLAKIGKAQITFQVALPNIMRETLPRTLVDDYPPTYDKMYRVIRVIM
jgi:hypothetical protein